MSSLGMIYSDNENRDGNGMVWLSVVILVSVLIAGLIQELV